MSEFETTRAANTDEHDDLEAAALSPSVRRLVRQYDLDLTGIHGSGPHGRIRVGDVMAVIGGRTHVPTEPKAALGSQAPERTAPFARGVETVAAPAQQPAARAAPVTSIFECDMSRVLAHQKLTREQGEEIALTSYFALACSAALNLLPEVRFGESGVALGVALATPAGTTLTTVIRDAEDQPLAAVNAQLIALAAHGGARSEALDDVAVVLHHHGLSGSVIALPMPLDGGQQASLGAGAVRRTVAVRTVNGEDAARIVAQCYLSLTFRPDAIDLPQANLFLNECVRTLELWPVREAPERS